jgi:hypothetical protein
MRRRLAALLLVVALAALAGCSAFGSGEPDPEALAENATYEWDSSVNASYNVSKNEYQAVLAVENRSHQEVWRRDELGNDEPVEISALKFRYPNGTVVNSTAMNVTRSRSRTNVSLPAEEGSVAFTAARARGKRFSVPLLTEGSHNVTLPSGARVGIPLLSQVRPGGAERSVDDATNRMTVHWDEARRGPVLTRYYLERDLLIFGGMFALLVVAAVGGTVYYLRQIRVLERRREEVGLDVETEDDDVDDSGPPPGMR